MIRSNQKASKSESLEERNNREGNDAADEYAVEGRKENMPPKKGLVKIEMQRTYVHEFLNMAATMVIEQSQSNVAVDRTPKA